MATYESPTSEPPGMSSFPRDIFWIILRYLSPRDIVCCRRVSRSWSEAFGNPDNLVPLLKELYPRAREVRELLNDSSTDESHIHIEDAAGWRKLFDQVAARYDHLARGTFRSVQKYKLCDDFGISGEREFFQVQPWENHASHLMLRVDCPFSEPFWTYEDGLLVYASADDRCLVLADLKEDRRFMIPFLIPGKVIRRIRLQNKLLVVEWAEPKAFHWLNDSDGVHRHFASSYDITQSPRGWDITFRNEWKIMFLGHPLSERDRFYSSHSNTHYAIYIWQPNRSLYTADEDAPIESLFVWDISKPSSYRPSLDPTGRLKDSEGDQGPSIVARFGFRELDFYTVRQRGFPGIIRLEVTEDAGYVEITENRCTEPDRLIGPAEWVSQVHTTSIPLFTHGPCWRRESELAFPPYRGNSSLQATPLGIIGSEMHGTLSSQK
ncbi:F-box domain protein [Aspergillus sclerotialis]|uniref:F-box domain protein n=1 Tax=Aspergillus sclerotialis TaxID=2070753 RepID=A0A3A2ZW47_9EURO|nr:F-box domain protein [Aspergillus sclerotialis]